MEDYRLSGAFLLHRGSYTGYYYKAYKNELKIFQYDDDELAYNVWFDEDLIIKHCIFFKLNETSNGLIVSLHNLSSTNDKISYISLERMQICKSFFVPGRITALLNIIDGVNYDEIQNLPNDYHEWPHMIAGVINNSITLFHINMDMESSCEPVAKHFVYERTNIFDGFENETLESENIREFTIDKMIYIHESYTFAFNSLEGEVVLLNLRSGKQLKQYLPQTVFHELRYQILEDDPKEQIFIWAIASRNNQLVATFGIIHRQNDSEFIKPYVLELDNNFNKFIAFNIFGSEENVFKPSSFSTFMWYNTHDQICTAFFDLETFSKRMRPSKSDILTYSNSNTFLNFQKNHKSKSRVIFDILVVENTVAALSPEKQSIRNSATSCLKFKILCSGSQIVKLEFKTKYIEYLKSVNLRSALFASEEVCIKLAKFVSFERPLNTDDGKFLILSTLLYNNFEVFIHQYIASATIEELKFLLNWIKKEIQKCETYDEHDQAMEIKASICEKLPPQVRFRSNIGFTPTTTVVNIKPKKENENSSYNKQIEILKEKFNTMEQSHETILKYCKQILENQQQQSRKRSSSNLVDCSTSPEKRRRLSVNPEQNDNAENANGFNGNQLLSPQYDRDNDVDNSSYHEETLSTPPTEQQNNETLDVIDNVVIVDNSRHPENVEDANGLNNGDSQPVIEQFDQDFDYLSYHEEIPSTPLTEEERNNQTQRLPFESLNPEDNSYQENELSDVEDTAEDDETDSEDENGDQSNISRNYEFVREVRPKTNVEYLCVYTNAERDKYFSYKFDKKSKRYCCIKCYNRNKRSWAKLVENENDDNWVELENWQHSSCARYQPKTVIKSPNYQICREMSNGKMVRCLYLNVGNDRWRRYTWKDQANQYVCTLCAKQNFHVSARLIKTNNEHWIELYGYEHVCALRDSP